MTLSLRSRLTLAYAVLIGLIFSIFGIIGGHLFLDNKVHMTREAMQHSAQTIRTEIAAHPLTTRRQMETLVHEKIHDHRVLVRIYPSTPPDLQRIFPWPALLGLRRIRMTFHEGFVDVIADYNAITTLVEHVFLVFGCVALAIVLVSWLIASGLTRQAMQPLILVTEELKRFAAGDFSPRPVGKADRDEFGELTTAYNAAALQVAAAFEEHILVEEQMKRFVADASHELRTPLTVLGGYIDILKKMDPTDTVGHERAFRTLHVETRRMRLLVDRLIALARLERNESIQRENLDMQTVANDVLLEISVAHNVKVELVVHENFQIYADLADVFDAIRNLLENAVKYGGGAAVALELRRTHEQGCVIVRDGGPGIPEHERAHLFERFFRGEQRSSVEGSGLGLSIVMRAMQRSNGSVALESAEPGNTAFSLCFPLARVQAGASHQD